MNHRRSTDSNRRGGGGAAARSAFSGPRRGGDLRRILPVALLLALTICAGIASAQLEPAPETPATPNTAYTPTPLDGEQYAWHMESGARFGQSTTIPDSWAPFTVDFFSLRFYSD